MAQLVLLVVAAAWAAVLLPPMLRSRVENRPNSSVTDFRRQLDKLQHTAGPRPGARAMGRPLAPTGLGRQARPVRPERPAMRSGVTVPQSVDVDRHPLERVDPRFLEQEPDRQRGGRHRSHGDPTGAHRRPEAMREPAPQRPAERRNDHRQHTAPRGMGRPVDTARRRRTNVMVMLVAVTACTLFLAATTGSSAMFYAFALSFLALMGFIYLLAQVNQRAVRHDDGWFDRA